jgi:hypothetical protein
VDSHLSFSRRGLLTLAAGLLCTLGFAASAHAMTTYNVTPGDATSLRDAFNSANSDGDDSTVNVPAGHYTLDPNDNGLDVFGDGTFTLVGAGARSTIIDGGGTPVIGEGETTDDTLITINAFCKCPSPAHATISGVTLTGADPDADGGAIFIGNAGPSFKASLHLFDSTITGNQAVNDGGGIFNEGDLVAERVTFSNNAAQADGAAIATKSEDESDIVKKTRGFIQDNFATTSITNSTFNNNTSDADTGCEGGGAIEQEGGNTSIVNSTIIGNASLDGTCEPVQPTGGGIDIEAGPATIVNSIVTGNTASPSEETTVTTRGGGGPVQPSNCSVDPVVKGNAGTLSSLGHNMESATDCGFTASGDQQNVADPKVGALGNNGGQMDTMALLAGSTAIDTADAAACPPTDEIGTTRPQGAGCDIGAYEVPVPVVATTPPAAKPATPTVAVAGIRRACVASSFHVRFHVGTANSTVKKVIVKLDGHRIRSTSRGSFTLTINGKKLKSGKHRLTITATNAAGQTKTVVRSFSVCKAAKPRRQAAPRFTG